MDNKKRITIIGIVGAVLLATLLIGYYFLQNTPFFSSQKIFYAEFSKISSLKLNAYVYFYGLDVGRVKDIALKKGDPKTIVVTFTVRADIDLPKNIVAEAYVPNPMFEAVLHLRHTPLKQYTTADFLREGDVISGKTGSYLHDIKKTMVDSIATASDSIFTNLFPSRDSIQRLVNNVETATVGLASTTATYRKIAHTNKTPIIGFMLNLRDISKKINAQEDSINLIIEKLTKETTVWAKKDLSKMLSGLNIEKVKLPNLDSINVKIIAYKNQIEAINSGQDTTYAWLVKDRQYKEKLLRQIDEMASNLQQIRTHPERFVSIRKKKNSK